MAQQGSTVQKLAGWLGDFFGWMKETLADPEARAALAADLGARPGPSQAPVFPESSESGLRAYRDAADPDLEAAIGALRDVHALFEAVRDFVASLDFGDWKPPLEEVFDGALDLLATNYVRLRHPRLFFWLQFIGFTFESSSQFGEGEASFDRSARGVVRMLSFALTGGEFSGDFQTDADARAWSFPLRLIAGGLAFIHQFGHGLHLWDRKHDAPLIDVLFGWDTVPGLPRTIADDVANRMLTVRLWDRPRDDDPDASTAEAASVSVALVPRDHGGPGAFVALGGQYELVHALSERWQMIAKVNGGAGLAFLFGGPQKVRFSGPDPDAAHVAMSLGLQSLPPVEGAPSFAIPHAKGNRFEIGRIAASFALGSKGLEVRTSLHDCVLALDGSTFDEFVSALLPRQNTQVAFSFGTGYSSDTGFFTTGDVPFVSGQGAAPRALPRATAFPTPAAPPDLPVLSTGGGGGGGVPIQISIGKSLGPVRLHHVVLNLARESTGEGPRTLIATAFSFSGHIGPVEVRVDRIGMEFALAFPDDRAQANLHFADLGVGFLAPAGVGLAVDAKQVKGGGFLFRDAAKHHYAGVMELTLSGIIALKAIGIIATRLPDGSKGYSLLILATAENTNDRTAILELPMGWRLTGIGGLIAIHRTVDEEALRAGLANRTLESVLFPKDPVRNAPTIVAALDRVFPIRRGSHLLGLIVRLVWGVPVIITLDLGLVLELGTRSRFVVLGRVRSILPRMDEDLLRLNLDAVGIFDFDQGTAAIDAVLVDSRLLRRFPITGSGALRARWSSPRSFALAVGGLHRAFTPPADFPKLERVTLSLTTGENPRLTCQGYFAVTSNTVQFGAHAQLYAAAYGFSVEGEAGYDVLIRLLPFHFLAEFYAGMQLRKGSRNLFKVRVEGALEGPVPLALRAKCTFEILWWDVTIRVNATLAEGERPPPPPAVSAFDQLRSALVDARSWSAELPAGQTRIVKLRETSAVDEVRAHPLGTLVVRQSVVPLNLARDIDKFGDSPVAGARRFAVTGVSVAGAAQPAIPLEEDFAPAQFFEMSDEARLASPSFEPMQAGLRIGSGDFAFAFGERLESPLEYETRIVDRSAAAAPASAGIYRLSEVGLTLQARDGAAGRSALRRERPAAPVFFAKVESPRWSRVAEDLAPLEARALTFVEALGAARGARRRLVVREFELEARP